MVHDAACSPTNKRKKGRRKKKEENKRIRRRKKKHTHLTHPRTAQQSRAEHSRVEACQYERRERGDPRATTTTTTTTTAAKKKKKTREGRERERETLECEVT